MTEGVSLKVQGDQRLIQGLDRLADPKRRQTMLASIGAYGVSSTTGRFETGTGPDGKPWKPSRRVRESGGKTLIGSPPRLVVSFSYATGASDVAWGTNLIYAGIHHFGGVIKPKTAKALRFKTKNGYAFAKMVKIPARPFLGVDDYDRTRILEIGATIMQGAFK